MVLVGSLAEGRVSQFRLRVVRGRQLVVDQLAVAHGKRSLNLVRALHQLLVLDYASVHL